ncbi:MAG: radical SAM protein [Smithella sp.]|nr:radical SAM protein [Smithella sp.]
MSKILLIKPRFLGLEFQALTQPLGLLYIAATLKQAGHEPRIHDCALDYQNLNLLKKTIIDWKPDFIGLSIIITELEQTNKIMALVRNVMPEVPVIFGGPWPSANPEESIKIFGADFVVLGEGELVFPRLVEAISKNLPTGSITGTASVSNGNITINTGRFLTEDELNHLPFPAWELLDHKLYADNFSFATVGGRPYISIVTSRGCPYRCAYCHQTMGKVFRKRSAESVLAEIEELRFKYGFKEFEIVDDCFNLDRQRMIAILTGIRDRIGDIKLHFPNALRSDMLEPGDMELFKQAGTVLACFAIETSSPRLQKMIRKNLNIEKASLAIQESVNAGIYTVGFFMIGFPTETYEEAYKTAEFAANSSLHHATFTYVTTFAGTELAEMSGHLFDSKTPTTDPRLINYFNNTLNVSAMTDKELRSVFRRAYRLFFFNPKRIFRLAIHHPRVLSLPRYAFFTLIKILPRKIQS